jgi:ethanolaminephosphotransferase
MNVNKAQQNPAPHTKDQKFPLAGLLPALTTWFLVPLYLYLQPTILEDHLIPFMLYVGLINAYSVGKIIIAHLTKNPKFPMTNSLLIPLWFGVIDSLGPKLGLWPSVLGSGVYQIAFMFACLGLGVGVHGSFIVSLSAHYLDRSNIVSMTV